MEDKDRVQWELIHYYVSAVLLGILGVTLSPLFLLSLGFLYIYKNVIVVYSAKFFKPKLIRVLNFQESFYATDQFWGNSAGSFALVVVVKGNVDIHEIRDEFSKKVIKAKTEDNQDDLFGKMSQIPQSFGGYYFWQKANYFLIHEHIREIETPTTEEALKKFVSTVLQLPFPNKRPLWEVLVLPHYETDKSALVLRLHQVVTDPEGAMSIVCALTNGTLAKEIEQVIPVTTPTDKQTQKTLSERRDEIFQSIANMMSLSKAFFQCITSSLEINPHPQVTDKSSGIVSWANAYEIPFNKIAVSQSVSFSSVVLSIVDGLLFAQDYANYDRQSWSVFKDLRSVLISVPVKKSTSFLDNENGFVVIKDLKETTETECNFISRLQHIDKQFIDAKGRCNPQGSVVLLKLLSVLPIQVEEVIVKWTFYGQTFLYQECLSELVVSSEQDESTECSSSDLISILTHEVLSIIPVCGLSWQRTAVAVAVNKFQGKVTTTLTMNSGPQKELDSLLENIPQELDNIFEDAPDENGFISIPII